MKRLAEWYRDVQKGWDAEMTSEIALLDSLSVGFHDCLFVLMPTYIIADNQTRWKVTGVKANSCPYCSLSGPQFVKHGSMRCPLPGHMRCADKGGVLQHLEPQEERPTQAADPAESSEEVNWPSEAKTVDTSSVANNASGLEEKSTSDLGSLSGTSRESSRRTMSCSESSSVVYEDVQSYATTTTVESSSSSQPRDGSAMESDHSSIFSVSSPLQTEAQPRTPQRQSNHAGGSSREKKGSLAKMGDAADAGATRGRSTDDSSVYESSIDAASKGSTSSPRTPSAVEDDISSVDVPPQSKLRSGFCTLSDIKAIEKSLALHVAIPDILSTVFPLSNIIQSRPVQGVQPEQTATGVFSVVPCDHMHDLLQVRTVLIPPTAARCLSSDP